MEFVFISRQRSCFVFVRLLYFSNLKQLNFLNFEAQFWLFSTTLKLHFSTAKNSYEIVFSNLKSAVLLGGNERAKSQNIFRPQYSNLVTFDWVTKKFAFKYNIFSRYFRLI